MNEEFFFDLLENVVPGYDINGKEIFKISNDIYFEKLSISGLEEMHRYSTDSRLYDYFEFDAFTSMDQTRSYLEKLLNRMSSKENKSAIYWFVRRKQDSYLLGTAGLVNINFSRKSVEWGYGVDPELWGNGYILQIQESLKHYVFETLCLNRLEGITMINNERTKSSLIASGMKNEGILRQFYCKNGIFIDGWKYSMLKEEYQLNAKSKISFNSNSCSKEEIINILREVLCEDVDENTTMYSSASWDSISHMNIMIKIYEEYKIKLSPIQISNATSVESLYILLNNLPKDA